MSMIVAFMLAAFAAFFTVTQPATVTGPETVSPMISFEVIYEAVDRAALTANADTVVPAIITAFIDRGYSVTQIREIEGRIYIEVFGEVDRINEVAAEIAQPGVIPFVELTFASIGVLE